jgi:hypothetical protein
MKRSGGTPLSAVPRRCIAAIAAAMMAPWLRGSARFGKFGVSYGAPLSLLASQALWPSSRKLGTTPSRPNTPAPNGQTPQSARRPTNAGPPNARPT